MNRTHANPLHRRRWPALCAWLAGATTLLAHAAAPTPPADLVVRHAAVYTVEAHTGWTDAFAVRDGRYVALGEREVRRHIGPQTRVLDLAGAMVMPGINDVHVHPLDGGWEDRFGCNFSPAATLEQVLARVGDCASKAGPGDWIVGAAFNGGLLAQMASTQALALLDKASGDHPVILRDDSFHNRWVNSEVLRRARLDAASTPPPGGFYVKDAGDGQLTGLMKEFPAFHAIEQLIPPRTPERQMEAARGAVRTLNGLGITGIQDAFAYESSLRLWGQLDAQKGLSLHYVGSLPFLPSPQAGDRSGMDLVQARNSLRSPHVAPDFAKLFLDGVPPARTSNMIEPYLPDAEHGAHYHGPSNYTTEQLVDMLTELDRRGVPVKMHAVGDGAVRQALDAVAEVRRRNGPKGPRHQVAHASLVAEADVARFKALNVVVDVSPMLWFPTGLNLASAAAIGPERADRFNPIRKLVQAGALVAGGSDWPAGQPTPNPWIGIEGMVTRRNPLGEVPGQLGADQAVDLATALRVYTLNSAQAMGLGPVTGSIAVGKSADFIVLDRHLFQVPITQVHQTQVKQVFFEGRELSLQP